MPLVPVQQAFALALEHHRAGRLSEAEQLYRQILAAHPHHSEASHLLGVIAHQVGRDALAVAWIGKAIQLDSRNPAFHISLGIALCRQGRLDEATASYQRALHLDPNRPDAWINLGIALADRGKLEEAIDAYRQALRIQPDVAEAHINLGNALKNRGQLNEAVAAYRRAIELKPEYPDAHNGLGAALADQGHLDEALPAYHRALQLQPNLVKGHFNLGNALKGKGRLDDALAAFQRALDLQPTYAEAHNNQGDVFKDQGRLPEAASAFRRALELKPDFAVAHNNLGAVLKEQGQLDEAVTAYRQALRLSPGYAEASNNLGAALLLQGRLDDAIAAFRRAHELRPEHSRMRSNLIYALYFHPDSDDVTIAREQKQWSERIGALANPSAPRHSHDLHPDRPLRIGYLSPDFRRHVIGQNLRPLFQHHDHHSFEITGYSDVISPDHVTAEFRQHADQWRNTATLGDEALATLIQQDGIDILVDLTQHLAGNRLPVFARQPAPVQVSFAGYPAGTGLSAIEYRISDGWLESKMGNRKQEIGWKSEPDLRSPKSDGPRAERVHLIDSFWCYDPYGIDIAINDPPLKDHGYVTFGSLNNFCKINERVLRVWARILTQLPASRLILLSGFGSHRQRTIDFLEQEGIAPNRVEFVALSPHRDYLEQYHRLDVVLDPFLYGGHTTSLDALWMGVPVVSLAGQQSVSRAGLSILSNLGSPELVAFSEEDYVNIALKLAGDLPRLTELRRTLRSRMEASVLTDAPRFARKIEAAYRAMWHQRCAEKIY